MTSATEKVAAAPFPHEAVWGGLLLLGALAARYAPHDLFPACAFKQLTGQPCLSCGGTRAVRALASLDVGLAFTMNPLVALFGLLAAVYVVYAALVLLGLKRPWRPEQSLLVQLLRYGLLPALLLNWAYLLWVGR